MTREYSGKAATKDCNGEAHKNPYIDHCMVCLPYWSKIYICPNHNNRLADNGWCEECSKYYEV
jgi:hypothetical protein